MKILVVITILVLTGCASIEYEFEDVPQHLLHVEEKYATIELVVTPEELKKGPDFPAG